MPFSAAGGRAGMIVSFLRMITYGRYYDPTYGIVD
jgi:hypothetical protein